MNTFRIRLHGHVTQADKARSDYFYLSFDLPSPARSLHVRYDYSARMSSDQTEGGNVIDIGLFDPSGADFPGGAGFRGWSGSARSEFTVANHEATPGYLPGPLPAGRYQVVLGLYRIWPAGADYDVMVEAELGPEAASSVDPKADQVAERPRLHPSAAEANALLVWLAGDLQSHTFHSDAAGSPQQLVAKARALGLDFLAITDHNTVSHHRLLPELAGDDLLLIPGQEVTTYYGHMNVWGTSHWCDFRSRNREEMAAIIDLAHARGGICSINHPKTGGPAWEYGDDLPVQCMEVWQGPWPHRNNESLALWDRLLGGGTSNAGRRRQRLSLPGRRRDQLSASGPTDHLGQGNRRYRRRDPRSHLRGSNLHQRDAGRAAHRADGQRQ
ncbi:MAG: CehA/McbA family metallohydrolase [Caldilineaceae bacterium]|nr:CehA/McbA family metallohydrolase [Caldilineaceae bacterium]